jgi:hypothetical protein
MINVEEDNIYLLENGVRMSLNEAISNWASRRHVLFNRFFGPQALLVSGYRSPPSSYALSDIRHELVSIEQHFTETADDRTVSSCAISGLFTWFTVPTGLLDPIF